MSLKNVLHQFGLEKANVAQKYYTGKGGNKKLCFKVVHCSFYVEILKKAN